MLTKKRPAASGFKKGEFRMFEIGLANSGSGWVKPLSSPIGFDHRFGRIKCAPLDPCGLQVLSLSNQRC